MRHPHLPGQHDMLPRLRHHALERRDHQDRAVDLRRTGDHVLHVVRVAGHVDVRVVPRRGLVFNVRDVDGDPARSLLGRAVDLPERHVPAHPPVGQDLGDGGGESRLPVVDVAHRADVEVRLVADIGLLGHDWLLLVPPAALADPRALTAAHDAAPSPAGSPERAGKGQPRAPPKASRPADDRSAQAAVIAARSSARAAKTANRNTPASVRHQPPSPQRVFLQPRK